MLAKTLSNVNAFVLQSENSKDLINEIIAKLRLMVKNEKGELENVFVIFSKLCIQHINIVPEEVKEENMKLLQKYLKTAVS
jgi:hypothetical protein